MTEHHEIWPAIYEFFGGDDNWEEAHRKAALWFETPNPLLGDITPNRMAEINREKLKKWILNQLRDNRRFDEPDTPAQRKLFE